MLDIYETKQPVIYKVLKNSLSNDKLSHAYLFEELTHGQAYNVAIAFAKSILCPYNYSEKKNKCVNCTQCSKIDKNEFSELEIIEPDGLWIKKNQLDILQRKFKMKSVESSKRVYIINHAEKMNASAANSILKFLEEPEPNIVAILITDNRYQLLNTIVSRCQIINFNHSNIENDEISPKFYISNPFIETLSEEEIESYIGDSINFINHYEQYKKDMILYTNKYFHSIFNTKDLVLFAFSIWILYYKNIIQYKCGIKINLFHKNVKDIENISKNNSLNTLLYKINILMNYQKYVYVNANINLLIDRLIIELNKGE